MSRSDVIKALNKLNRLHAEAEGQGGMVGGGRKRVGMMPMGMGGVTIPYFGSGYGGEIYNTPAPFGYGCDMGYGYGDGGALVAGRVPKKCIPQWTEYQACAFPSKVKRYNKRVARYLNPAANELSTWQKLLKVIATWNKSQGVRLTLDQIRDIAESVYQSGDRKLGTKGFVTDPTWANLVGNTNFPVKAPKRAPAIKNAYYNRLTPAQQAVYAQQLAAITPFNPNLPSMSSAHV